MTHKDELGLGELVKRLGTPHTLDIRDIVQVRALLDLVAVERSEAATAITTLIAERDGALAKWERADGMDGAVVHAIREMLNAHNVPLSAFIDDHVANAIRQRNAAEAQLKAAREALERSVAILNGELGSSWGDRNQADWMAIDTALSLDTNKGDGGNKPS